MTAEKHDENALNSVLWVKVVLIILAAILLVVWALMKAALAGNPETLHLTWDNLGEQETLPPGTEVYASGEVFLYQTGAHTIFIEYGRELEEQELIEPFSPDALQLQVIRESDLGELVLDATEPLRFNVGREVHIAAMSTHIPARGNYVVNAVATLEEPVNGVTLSFRKDPGARYFRAGITIALIVLGCGGALWFLLQRDHPQPGHLG